MIKILACEGQSEVALIQSLFDFGHFPPLSGFFLGQPLHVRQITKYIPLINSSPISTDIEILRIGDTQKDPLSMKGLELREEHITVTKYCTRPEIEILVIINEGLYQDYQKRRRIQKTPRCT